ncbi:terpene synthase family protein, partial [Escherichia coli]
MAVIVHCLRRLVKKLRITSGFSPILGYFQDESSTSGDPVHDPRVAYNATFLLPDMEKMCSSLPNLGVNPYHHEVARDSREWFHSRTRGLLGPQTQAAFTSWNLELCASYSYPYVDKDGLRAIMDWQNILWFLDELIDTETGRDAQETAAVVIHMLHEPNFDDGTPLCTMLKDFHRGHLSKRRLTSGAISRFLRHSSVLFSAMAKEAEHRDKGEILSVEEYLKFRRDTSGVLTCFDVIDLCMNVDLPGEIYDDAVFQKGYTAALHLVFLTNDLYSYNMEQAKGHSAENILTVLMTETGIDLQAAADYVGALCENYLKEFQEAKTALDDRLVHETNNSRAVSFGNALVSLVRYGHCVR